MKVSIYFCCAMLAASAVCAWGFPAGDTNGHGGSPGLRRVVRESRPASRHTQRRNDRIKSPGYLEYSVVEEEKGGAVVPSEGGRRFRRNSYDGEDAFSGVGGRVHGLQGAYRPSLGRDYYDRKHTAKFGDTSDLYRSDCIHGSDCEPKARKLFVLYGSSRMP